MLSLFLSLLFREDFDDSFIRKVNDTNFRTIFRNEKSGFLFFHHVGVLVSDTAYLRYVDIARKYKNSSRFYVSIPFDSPHFCHDMKITGFPTLYYLRNLTSYDELYGAFTSHNINIFISEHTNYTIPKLTIEKESQEIISQAKTVYEASDSLLSLVKTDAFDNSEYVFIFTQEKSKYAKVAKTFAEKLKSSQIKFFLVSQKPSLGTLSIKFPSILYIRKGDNSPFVYDGEPFLDKMIKWFNSIPRSLIVSFQPSILFSEDGSATKTILHFQHRDQVMSEMNSLMDISNNFPTIKIAYADPNEYKKYSNLFNASANDNVCIESNYTTFIFAKCTSSDDIQQFLKKQIDQSKINITDVPPEAYNYIAQTDEFGFKALLKRGPTFVAFTAPKEICPECPEFENNIEISSRKISAILNMNSTQNSEKKKLFVNWIQWNIPTKYQMPSFTETIKMRIPSLYYFPSSDNISAAVQYSGKSDYIAIVEWVNEQKNYFNIYDFLERESKEYNDPYDAL